MRGGKPRTVIAAKGSGIKTGKRRKARAAILKKRPKAVIKVGSDPGAVADSLYASKRHVDDPHTEKTIKRSHKGVKGMDIDEYRQLVHDHLKQLHKNGPY